MSEEKSNQEQERSESGAPLYRYNLEDKKEFTPVTGNNDSIDQISKHIEKHVGEIEGVFHELVSDLVHIDIHWVKPTKDKPFFTLVTSGMSDLPMTVPTGFEDHKYVELAIMLPENWFGSDFSTANYELQFEDENVYWPIRWLKILARFPHEYSTWLCNEHTIPNGEEASPFCDQTKLGCMMLMPSICHDSGFYSLQVNDEKTIHFYCLVPLYKEEMDFKLNNGSEALIEKFDEIGVSDVLDLNRKNVCL